MTRERDRWRLVQEIFHDAVDLPEPRRASFLGERCAGDPALRAEVEELLASDARSGGLLGGDTGEMIGALAADALLGVEAPSLEGKRVGPYSLVSLLGRGGMGAVYLAERQDVGLRCALKVVKGELAAPDNTQRLLFERRLLARLRHPHIAALLDAGVMEDGTPWFALELVDGEPIDVYCDRRRLGVAQRLRIFEGVCDAVAYAHRNLIVHRDLKPGNILVSEAEGPKLLDFGIAKLLEEREERLTGTGMRLLTPEYAAPEQLMAEPVTTATDVYALGLVLYELLCGHRAVRIDNLTPGEVHHRVMEATIARPSTAAGRLEALPGGRAVAPDAVAEARGTEPAHLRRRLAGDLDAIVMRALAREPDRRYPSAAALLDDLRRHRAGHPVAARPDTLSYRARTFVRRHRAAVASASAAAMMLTAFAVSTSVQQSRTARERDRAETEAAKARQVSGFLIDLFDVADPFSATEVRADSITLRDFLVQRGDRIASFDAQPEVQLQALNVVGKMYFGLGLYDSAEPLYRRALELGRRLEPGGSADLAAALVGLGDLHRARTELEESERAYREGLEIAERLGPGGVEVSALALNGLGEVLRQAGRHDEAEAPLRAALARRRELYGPRSTQAADGLNNLGLLLWARGDAIGAAPLLEEALDIHRERLPRTHPMTAAVLNNLGLVRKARGDLAGAEAPLRESLEIKRELFGDRHWRTANGRLNLASLLLALDRPADAEPLASDALASLRQEFGERHELIGIALGHLGESHRRRGGTAEAERHLRESIAAFERVLTPEHQRIATSRLALGRFLLAQERPTEARPHLERALDAYRARDGEEHERTARAAAWLAACLTALGEVRAAEPLLRRAVAFHSARGTLASEDGATALRLLAELEEARGKPRLARGAPSSPR